MNSRTNLTSNQHIKSNKKTEGKIHKGSCESVQNPSYKPTKKKASMSCSTVNLKKCKQNSFTSSNMSMTQKPIIRSRIKSSKQSLTDSSSIEKFKYRRTCLAQVDVNSGNYAEIIRLTSLLDEAYSKIKELSMENKTLLSNQRVQERAIRNTNDLVGDYPKMVEKLMEEIRVLKIQNKRYGDKLLITERMYSNQNKKGTLQDISEGNGSDYKERFFKLNEEYEKQKLRISEYEKEKENFQKIGIQFSKRTKMLKEKLIENKILTQKNQKLEKEIFKLRDEFDIYRKRMKVQNNSYVEKNKQSINRQANGSNIQESKKKTDASSIITVATTTTAIKAKKSRKPSRQHHTRKIINQENIDDNKDVDKIISNSSQEDLEVNDDKEEKKEEKKTDIDKKNDNENEKKKTENKENVGKSGRPKTTEKKHREAKTRKVDKIEKNEKNENKIINTENNETNDKENPDIYSDDFDEIDENDQKFFVPSQEETLKPSTFIKPNLYYSSNCTPEPEMEDLEIPENAKVDNAEEKCLDLDDLDIKENLNNDFPVFNDKEENLSFLNDFTDNAKFNDDSLLNLDNNKNVANENITENINITTSTKNDGILNNTDDNKGKNAENAESQDSLSLIEYQFSDET